MVVSPFGATFKVYNPCLKSIRLIFIFSSAVTIALV
ncbi:hypothetical protein vBEcoMWL3_gp065 [Escherichia phage vB_EcoM_WL-3]|nr:hypothetical protein vBEcoMWL3_gp065 [Escherichia phage vB_EcoM_WL-3]